MLNQQCRLAGMCAQHSILCLVALCPQALMQQPRPVMPCPCWSGCAQPLPPCQRVQQQCCSPPQTAWQVGGSRRIACCRYCVQHTALSHFAVLSAANAVDGAWILNVVVV